MKQNIFQRQQWPFRPSSLTYSVWGIFDLGGEKTPLCPEAQWVGKDPEVFESLSCFLQSFVLSL